MLLALLAMVVGQSCAASMAIVMTSVSNNSQHHQNVTSNKHQSTEETSIVGSKSSMLHSRHIDSHSHSLRSNADPIVTNESSSSHQCCDDSSLALDCESCKVNDFVSLVKDQSKVKYVEHAALESAKPETSVFIAHAEFIAVKLFSPPKIYLNHCRFLI